MSGEAVAGRAASGRRGVNVVGTCGKTGARGRQPPTTTRQDTVPSVKLIAQHSLDEHRLRLWEWTEYMRDIERSAAHRVLDVQGLERSVVQQPAHERCMAMLRSSVERSASARMCHVHREVRRQQSQPDCYYEQSQDERPEARPRLPAMADVDRGIVTEAGEHVWRGKGVHAREHQF